MFGSNRIDAELLKAYRSQNGDSLGALSASGPVLLGIFTTFRVHFLQGDGCGAGGKTKGY